MNLQYQFDFTSALFPPQPSEDDATNDGRYGKGLSEWLAAQLKANGISQADIITEDYGWIITFDFQSVVCEILCGNTDDIGKEWQVWGRLRPTLYQRFFRSDMLRQMRFNIRQVVQGILQSEGQIEKMRSSELS